MAIDAYFLLPPNWAEPVVLKRRWQTSITTSVSGVEKRGGLHTWPRRSLEFTVNMLSLNQSSYVHRRLWINLGKVIGVPIWPSMARLTVESLAGAGLITVDSTVGKWFEDGETLIFLDPDTIGNFEAAVIDGEPGENIINIEGVTENTWPVGTLVLPILPALLGQKAEMNAMTAETGEMIVEATEAAIAHGS
jgi:hypothetical protein